jgi:acetyltransferase-like isoleucine patch superfamily enzyme
MIAINELKSKISFFLRRCVVYYYRKMGVSIGKNVFISHAAKIDTTYRNSVFIGDNCYITYGASITSHDHSVYRMVPISEDDGRGVVRIKKNVFIGNSAQVLRNTTIGENSVVAAGAIVTKDVPANVVVAGNPAVIIKHFKPIN